MIFSRANRHILLAMGFVLALFSLLESFSFSGECEPYGSVTYKGWTAPDGYKVAATVGSQEFAQCEVKYGKYKLSIPADNVQTPDKKEGWVEGDIITLKVNGQTAVPQVMAEAITKEVNISVPSLGTELTTWGKIKALFR